MGASQSSTQPAPRNASPALIDETARRDAIARELAELRLADPSIRNPHASAHVKHSAVAEWKARAEARPGQAIASTMLQKQDLNAALVGRSAVLADQHVYNTAIPHEQTPVTNQMSSGRCWLFATTSVRSGSLSLTRAATLLASRSPRISASTVPSSSRSRTSSCASVLAVITDLPGLGLHREGQLAARARHRARRRAARRSHDAVPAQRPKERRWTVGHGRKCVLAACGPC